MFFSAVCLWNCFCCQRLGLTHVYGRPCTQLHNISTEIPKQTLVCNFNNFQTYFNPNALTLIRSLITGGATQELEQVRNLSDNLIMNPSLPDLSGGRWSEGRLLDPKDFEQPRSM